MSFVNNFVGIQIWLNASCLLCPDPTRPWFVRVSDSTGALRLIDKTRMKSKSNTFLFLSVSSGFPLVVLAINRAGQWSTMQLQAEGTVGLLSARPVGQLSPMAQQWTGWKRLPVVYSGFDFDKSIYV